VSGLFVVMSELLLRPDMSGEDAAGGRQPDLAERHGELRAILDVSRAVATAAPLPDVLVTIAETAARQARAQSAAVLLVDSHGGLHLAGSYQLSPQYKETIRTASPDALPVTSVVRLGRRVIVADTEADDVWRPWLHLSRREGYRAVVALPLVIDSTFLGGLSVYRPVAGPWSAVELDRLDLISSHIASAVRTAQLIDEQKHRLTALARAARGLREQTNEHVDRLRTIGRLLERGDDHDADQFVAAIENDLHETYSAVGDRVHNRILAGLLLADIAVARQRGIQLRIVPRTRVTSLPSGLTEAETVSLVGNLLDNAFDAVEGLPATRRRVSLLITQDANQTMVRVRDWGRGLRGRSRAELLAPGFSTKRGHGGMGLSFVAELVESTGGFMKLERPKVGAAFTVVIPDA